MKINKIAALLKKGKCVYLYDAPDGSQWAGNGAAVYPLFGLPRLEEESIYTIFDVTEKQREKFYFNHTELPEGINFTDMDATENMIESGSITIGAAGRVLKTFQTQRGLVFVDTAYLTPFADALDYLEYFERIADNGQLYIAVKNGFMLVGVISPYDLVSKEFIGQLEDLLSQCRIALEIKQERAAAQDADQTTIGLE